MLSQFSLVLLVLAGPGIHAALVQQAQTCDAAILWPIQSDRPQDDVISSDLFVGLSIPVKATMLMIYGLDPQFLYRASPVDQVTECLLEAQLQNLELYDFETKSNYCKLRFPFSLHLKIFKKPIKGQAFGILPLIVEEAYNHIRQVPGSIAQWSNGYNMQDVACNIQILFSRITPLPLRRHPISEIYAKDPADLKRILDSSDKSPVFLVTQTGVHIVTSKGLNGWQGYDIKEPSKTITWTLEQLRSGTLSASLIYNGDHEALPLGGPSLCTDEKIFTVKV